MELLTRNGRNNNNGSFNWKDALLDAAIMAGLTFFTALGGMAVVNPVTGPVIVGAAIAAATEFFMILAIKRKLREKKH